MRASIGPTTPGPGRRHLVRNEDGFAAGAEALIFGVLVFVVGSIVLLNAWSVIDAKFATAAAARHAVRAAVEAPLGADLQTVAATAATDVLVHHGRDDAAPTVQWEGPGRRPEQIRCAVVRYRVTTRVGVLLAPGISERIGFEVSSVYGERIDPFRSGLEGSDCAH